MVHPADLAEKDADELRRMADRAFDRHAQARKARRSGGQPGRTDTHMDEVMKSHLGTVRAIEKELRSRGFDPTEEGGY